MLFIGFWRHMEWELLTRGMKGKCAYLFYPENVLIQLAEVETDS